jgi:serine/threonine protein kinase
MNDFKSVKVIGRGAFGEVRLCTSNTGEVVAIKKMKK